MCQDIVNYYDFFKHPDGLSSTRFWRRYQSLQRFQHSRPLSTKRINRYLLRLFQITRNPPLPKLSRCCKLIGLFSRHPDALHPLRSVKTLWITPNVSSIQRFYIIPPVSGHCQLFGFLQTSKGPGPTLHQHHPNAIFKLPKTLQTFIDLPFNRSSTQNHQDPKQTQEMT